MYVDENQTQKSASEKQKIPKKYLPRKNQFFEISEIKITYKARIVLCVQTCVSYLDSLVPLVAIYVSIEIDSQQRQRRYDNGRFIEIVKNIRLDFASQPVLFCGLRWPLSVFGVKY